MIALDSQPFSVVEDEGFRRLIIDQDIHCQAEGTEVVAVLSSVEEITQSILYVSVSVVLPYIRMLTKTLEKHHDDVVQGMKREMLKSD